jgi:hypothetical protein
MSDCNTNAYEIAAQLRQHPEIDEVRASGRRITVVHVPDSRHTEKFPADAVTAINRRIADTLWQPDYGDKRVERELCEKHDVVGGYSHDAIAAGRPELQIHLVQ